MSTKTKKKKNITRTKQSVNPAKTKDHSTTLLKKQQKANAKLKNQTPKNNVQTLVKPDPNDKEATRAYYEAKSKAKVKGEWNPKKDVKPAKNNKVSKNHVRTNPFAHAYKVFKIAVTKQLKKEDYFRVAVGLISFAVIFAMVILPVLSLFGWGGFGSRLW